MRVFQTSQVSNALSISVIPFRARFTNLGATGRLGPTSLGSHYAGADHEKMVTVRNGIQYWRVPYTGKYEITAVGAAGGYAVNCGSFARGRGAYMKGDFFLNKGEVLKILIGQEGVKNKACYSTGGGGGTFIATSSNTPLIVAGGGGGMENLKIRLKNCDASTETFGRKNQCRSSCRVWPGGANGNGASKAHTSSSGEIDFFSCINQYRTCTRTISNIVS
jgi:tripartite motif-containing protein 56